MKSLKDSLCRVAAEMRGTERRDRPGPSERSFVRAGSGPIVVVEVPSDLVDALYLGFEFLDTPRGNRHRDGFQRRQRRSTCDVALAVRRERREHLCHLRPLAAQARHDCTLATATRIFAALRPRAIGGMTVHRWEDRGVDLNREAVEAHQARLTSVAADFGFGLGPRVSEAVTLAEDLVAAGYSGVATIEVAALRRDATLSDAEPRLRQMLAELGAEPPPREDGDAWREWLARAFAFGRLPLIDFCGRFLELAPRVEQQTHLDQMVLRQLADFDAEASPAEKARLVERMRVEVRQALGSPVAGPQNP